MALGLAQYAVGRRRLGPEANVVPDPLPPARRPVAIAAALGVVAVIVILVLLGVITAANLAAITVVVIAAASVAYFAIILSSKRISGLERRRVVGFIPMFLASFVFFSLFQQQFTVVVIYVDERLDRDLFGWEMPVPWANAINPIFPVGGARHRGRRVLRDLLRPRPRGALLPHRRLAVVFGLVLAVSVPAIRKLMPGVH